MSAGNIGIMRYAEGQTDAKWLFVSLSPDLDPLDDNGLCLVVNCVEDAVIADPDPVTFLVYELFTSVRSWIF